MAEIDSLIKRTQTQNKFPLLTSFDTYTKKRNNGNRISEKERDIKQNKGYCTDVLL
jgi:hypothetical protein